MNRKSGEMNVYAKMVISAAGIRNTFKFLLPKETVFNLRRYIRLNPLNAMKKCIGKYRLLKSSAANNY